MSNYYRPGMELPVDYRKLSRNERREIRLRYIRRQSGLCSHCGGDLNHDSLEKHLTVQPWLFPEGFFTHPVHLHHCHKTGMTIGAVHAHCNAVLWQYHGE